MIDAFGIDRLTTLELFSTFVENSIECNLDFCILIAEQLIIRDENYDRRFDLLLSEFVRCHNKDVLIEICIYMAKSSQWLKPSNSIRLISNLLRREYISKAEAVSILQNFSLDQRNTLSDEELGIIELADAAYEDSSEGFIGIEEADDLIDKLKAFRSDSGKITK